MTVTVEEYVTGGTSLRKEFDAGSILALSVKSEVVISVEAGTKLTLTTAAVEGQGERSNNKLASLQFAADKFSEWLTLCPLSHGTVPIVSGLGLEFQGPNSFRVKTTGLSPINVFGSIVSTAAVQGENGKVESSNMATKQSKATTIESEGTAFAEENDRQNPFTEEKGSKKKKRKFSEEAELEAKPKEEDNSHSDPEEPQLSKKQRRKLAKQKAKELAEAVATINQHSKNNQASSTTKNSSVIEITKERRLRGGIMVKDLVVGTGALVKAGRKIGINYVGSFPDGKTFDKNMNKKSPLEFRQGTGQVVRGLEKGLEGMRVGGEREITIPPALAYGEKGSGPIPPNSTLVFSVQLLSVG